MHVSVSVHMCFVYLCLYKLVYVCISMCVFMSLYVALCVFMCVCTNALMTVRIHTFYTCVFGLCTQVPGTASKCTLCTGQSPGLICTPALPLTSFLSKLHCVSESQYSYLQNST